MCVVDYLGYRIQALSLLPINSGTIKYGSNDAAQTIHTDSKMIELLKISCQKMNLKPHTVLERSSNTEKTLYSCCDLEGHLGTDGRYYLLDFARSCPPGWSVLHFLIFCSVPPVTKGSHLFRLFRPEFVRWHERPLNPDAFSKFGTTNWEEDCQEIVCAFHTFTEKSTFFCGEFLIFSDSIGCRIF